MLTIREQIYTGILQGLTALEKASVTQSEEDFVTEAIDKVTKARECSCEPTRAAVDNILIFATKAERLAAKQKVLNGTP